MSQHLPLETTASEGSETVPRDMLARRRFVRGVFAAPAIMTVCSGSAHAAAVSATCLQKGQPPAPEPSADPFWSGAETPTWLRAPVYEQGGVKYVSYGDLNVIGRGTAPPVPMASPADYLEINADGALTGNVLVSPKPAPASSPTNSAVLVRIDGGGYVVGTGRGFGTQGALISMTCWMSVTPFA
jgi:hypothetical protein